MALPQRLRYSTTGRYIPKRKSPELDLQKRVCNYLRKYYPGVIFHSDYSAGLGLTMNQATINKSLQSTTGLPDLYILKKSRGYSGFLLELKKEGTTVILKNGLNKGRLTSDPHIRHQAIQLKKLADEGFYTNFAVGYEDAIRKIDWYFERPHRVSLFEEI